MQKIGYTVNGIREYCRHTDVNSYCKRHVRHTFNTDELTIDNTIPVLETPTVLDTAVVEPTVGYKITDEGKFAPNCPECNGVGVMGEKYCPACKGKGWEVTHKGYDSLEEYVETINSEPAINEELVDAKAASQSVQQVKGTVGDLVKISGNVAMVKNLHTKYGATVMMQITDPTYDNVVFFTRNKWVNKFKKGDNITVKGYVKEFSEYNGNPQTVLRNPVLSE